MQDNEQLILKALEAIKANDHLKAAEYLEDLLREDPQNDEAWVMAAKLFKDPEKRLEYAQKALEVDPNNNEAAWLVKTLPAEVAIHHRRQSTFIFLDGILIVAIALITMGALLWFGGVFQARPQPIQVSAENAPLEIESEKLKTESEKTITNHKLESKSAIPVSPNSANSNISASPVMSNDSQVIAFTTYTNQIYTFDIQQKRSTLISAGLDSLPANGASTNPSISADGQFVVFESTAHNLQMSSFPDGIYGNNNAKNVFLFDSLTEEIQLISKTIDNEPINDNSTTSLNSVISKDGAFVVYQSANPYIVPDDRNGRTDIFLYEIATDKTTRISVNLDGIESNNHSAHPDISHNGQFVVFSSLSTNLDKDLPANKWHVFVHNRITGSTKRISPAGEDSDYPVISADGHTIAFIQLSQRLSFVRSEERYRSPVEILVWNRSNGRSENISEVLKSLPYLTSGSLDSTHVSLSPDGRYIVFGQSSKYLKTQSPNTKIRDAFVYDRETQETHQFGSEGDDPSDDGLYDSVISADGQWLVFVTQDRELTFSYNGLTVLMAPTGFRQNE